jgi:hypothetical protein
MLDIRNWFWFGLRLWIYSTILFLIFIGLICAFAFWYYWYVFRRRSETKQEIQTKLFDRSFIFHTLSFQISDSGVIGLSLQLSPLEKQLIELAELNERQYEISSLDIQDEQMEIMFAKSDIRLTIKHEKLEQQRLGVFSLISEMNFYI